MKNILVAHTSARVILDALEKLETSGGYQVVGWTAHPGATANIQQRFPNAKVLDCYPLMHANVDHLCEVLGCNPDIAPLSPSMQERLGSGRHLVSDCLLHRGAGTYAYTHQELLNDVNSYFIIAQTLLSRFKPDVIVFEVPPHAMYDLALEVLAREAGIPCLVIVATHMPGISKIVSRYRPTFEVVSIPETLQTKVDQKRIIIRNCLDSSYVPFYQKPLFNVNMKEEGYYRNKVENRIILRRSIKELFQILLHKARWRGEDISCSYIKSIFNPLAKKRGDTLHYAVNNLRGLEQEKFYRENTLKNFHAVKGKKIIFVPLSLQPEMSTLPTAGHMFNQMTYLRMLYSATKPYKEIAVLVKENPNQFSYPSGPQVRSVQFYRDILEMGFGLVDLNTPSQEIVRMATAVVVTTGTAGFEAAHVYNKRAICFAPNWYSQHPMVTLVNEYTDLLAAINEIDAGVESGQSCLREEYVEQLIDDCLYLWPDAETVEKEGFDANSMAHNLAAAIDYFCSNNVSRTSYRIA